MLIKFIIGLNSKGNPVESSCEPKSFYLNKNKKIKKYFNASERFLTKVMFKKSVLDKYISEPSKYLVEDGSLKCLDESWMLIMDNDQQNYVMVWLGDLNMLPFTEQIHWRSYNLPIEGIISKTSFNRSFNCEFDNPTQLDLLFKYKYRRFSQAFYFKYGWSLFLSLNDDSYCLETLSIPSAINDQKQFDITLGMIVKIMIDAINEEGISKKVPISKSLRSKEKLETLLKNLKIKNSSKEKIISFCEKQYGDTEKGLKKLELFLNAKQFDKDVVLKIIKYLKNLQSFRSSSTAHLKGKNFIKHKKEFAEESLQKSFIAILSQCIFIIDELTKHFFKNCNIDDLLLQNSSIYKELKNETTILSNNQIQN